MIVTCFWKLGKVSALFVNRPWLSFSAKTNLSVNLWWWILDESIIENVTLHSNMKLKFYVVLRVQANFLSRKNWHNWNFVQIVAKLAFFSIQDNFIVCQSVVNYLTIQKFTSFSHISMLFSLFGIFSLEEVVNVSRFSQELALLKFVLDRRKI